MTYNNSGVSKIRAITGDKNELYGVEKPIPLSTGREWDKETGLYYYRARYYDPMEGRFISKDPIGFNGGDSNLYGYVQSNQINMTDPDGLRGIAPYLVPLLPALRDAVYKMATVRPGKTLDTVERTYEYLRDNACKEKEPTPPPIEGYSPFSPQPYNSPFTPTPNKPRLVQ